MMPAPPGAGRRMTLLDLFLFWRLCALVRLARYEMERGNQCARWAEAARCRADARRAEAQAIAVRLGFHD